MKSHSGDDAIAAFKECEFRLSLMFPPGEFKLARVHSDCELSLIGPLREYLYFSKFFNSSAFFTMASQRSLLHTLAEGTL